MRDQLFIQGFLHIDMRDRDGRSVLTRRARNTVVRSGAEIVAGLFSGQASTPVNGMAVGTNAEPISAPYELGALNGLDEAGAALVGALAVAISPENVKVETLASDQRVRVAIRGVLPAGAARAADGQTVMIGEAALGVLNADASGLASIYNRVVFEPIPKGKDHELVFYWEIIFPYGG